MTALLERLRNGLIISCQAEGDDPFNAPENLALFARAAEMGGADAIRTSGIDNVAAISDSVTIPVIGLVKSVYPDGSILITPDRDALAALVENGADVVTLDATDRPRPDGASPLDLLRWAVRNLNVPVMADISNVEEGLRAAEAGASLVGTTLSGYTPYSKQTENPFVPDLKLVRDLATRLPNTPIIAEGRIMSPRMAQEAISAGAFAVVIGTALTRPRVMAQYFKQAIRTPGTLASY